MHTRFLGHAIVVLSLVVGAGLRPAAAGSFDFLFDMAKVGNDEQYFLHLGYSSYDIPRPVFEPALPLFRPGGDDLAVAMYLAPHCGSSFQMMADLRHAGYSWSFVFGRCGVAVDVLFVGMDRDPGPPYGKAWGYWKKHGRSARLYDADIVQLARLQVGHRVSGVPLYDLAAGSARGRSVYEYVGDAKGRPWKGGKPGKGSAAAASAGGPPGQGGGPPGHSGDKGQGKGKGHGK